MMRVGVIGAGVAGLVTAKVLKQDGFEVIVFEKEPGVGGVWARSRAYPGLRANNPQEAYAFSDFSYPETADEFPAAEQIREYLERYAEQFGLRPHLRLSTEVHSITRRPAGAGGSHPGFRITARPVDASTPPVDHDFDYVVVCNGVFSQPFIPDFKGGEQFAGDIVHSSQFARIQRLKGKRVIVVGSGKSALDCASFAGREADSCALVFRKPHWMLPRYFGRSRVDREVMTRLTELLTFPAYHHISTTERVARWAGIPLLPVVWYLRKAQRRVIARQCRMPDMMVPEAPIHEHIYHIGIGTDIYDAIREGRVQPRRAAIDEFLDRKRVRLDSGEVLEADLVVCGTGWRRCVAFLDQDLLREVRPEGSFRLYRHILPPGERRLGFVGYASSTNSPLTSEIAAHWLAQCFRGELRLPGAAAMERNIDRVAAWTEATLPEQKEGFFIGAYVAHYIDQLMRDMGLGTRRTGRLAEEYCGPFWARRYRGLADERVRTRAAT